MKSRLIKGDWLKNIEEIKDSSIDFICIDPPYGKIQGMKLSGQEEAIKWDINIDWKKMFKEFNRIIKPGGTIAVFGQEPTYSEMILSNKKNFKYEYVWEKNNAAQGYHSRIMPLIYTEKICVFIKPGGQRTFNKPISKNIIDKKVHFTRWYAQYIYLKIGETRRNIHKKMGHRKLEFFFYYVGSHFGIPSEKIYGELIEKYKINKFENFIDYKKLKSIWKKEKFLEKGVKLNPKKYNGTFSNILKISKDYKPYYHPTQKPLKLMELLVEIYSNEGEVVLDCFAGSGSTLLAAKNKNRKYIGIELNEKFFEIMKERLNF